MLSKIPKGPLTLPIYLYRDRRSVFLVCVTSQFINNLIEKHMDEVYRILMHLMITLGVGRFFKRSQNRDIQIYSNVDWVVSIIDQRSTIGYCTYI